MFNKFYSKYYHKYEVCMIFEVAFSLLLIISLTILSPIDSFSESSIDQNQGKSNDIVYALGTTDKNSTRALVQEIPSSKIQILYDVPLIPQETGMSCWAAGAAMIVSWGNNITISALDCECRRILESV
jgi:Papain-like cysteine protease AvrRpt2